MRLKRWVVILIAIIISVLMFFSIKNNGNTLELNGILSMVLGSCTYFIIREA